MISRVNGPAAPGRRFTFGQILAVNALVGVLAAVVFPMTIGTETRSAGFANRIGLANAGPLTAGELPPGIPARLRAQILACGAPAPFQLPINRPKTVLRKPVQTAMTVTLAN